MIIIAKKKKRKPSKITIMRRIVRNRQYEKVEGKVVDMQTANMIVTVYDALSEKNKRIYANMKLNEMVAMGWEIIKRSKRKR